MKIQYNPKEPCKVLFEEHVQSDFYEDTIRFLNRIIKKYKICIVSDVSISAEKITLQGKRGTKDTMIHFWSQNWHDAQIWESDKYMSALEVQRKMIDEIDLEIFQSCEEDWVHWDLF